MTHIYERLFLKCPYIRARDYLSESMESAAQDKTVQTLPLTAPLGVLPRPLEKNVLVRYEHGRDPLHFDEPWNVYWTPEGGGPYPDFSGQITIRADESYRSAVLEIRGDYAPPFGALGRAFDMIAGAKIASATAKTLLRQIGSVMEERYRTEEAQKTQAAG